jgi:hypothetical protein
MEIKPHKGNNAWNFFVGEPHGKDIALMMETASTTQTLVNFYQTI